MMIWKPMITKIYNSICPIVLCLPRKQSDDSLIYYFIVVNRMIKRTNFSYIICNIISRNAVALCDHYAIY
ncbi:hypothetical protein MTBSS4_110017 [Magnetospirillum sp. SS-4]|nr:hypothetical protein MTBSS4_110017 [Magnetospirillum sp. SS-4]